MYFVLLHKNKQLIQILQAWEMCRAGEFNLSYESLTSRAARQTLRDLHETETEFLAELRRPRSHVLAPVLSHDEALLEDSEELELNIPGDDSSVPLEVVEDDVNGNFSTEPEQAFVMGQLPNLNPSPDTSHDISRSYSKAT